MVNLEHLQGGSFQIYFSLKNNVSVAIGSIGYYVLPEGHYVFNGKSNRQLLPTIRRLISPRKTIRMHMDYLSILDEFQADNILIFPEIYDPCMLQNIVIRFSRGHEFVPRFGIQSDDRCESHLVYIPGNVDEVIEKMITTFSPVQLTRDELYA